MTLTYLPPFLDNKYDITKHPHYQYHGQAPVIDNGKIIKKGKHWFETDRYIHNYRKGVAGFKESTEDNKEKNNRKRPFNFRTFFGNLLNEILHEDPNFKISSK